MNAISPRSVRFLIVWAAIALLLLLYTHGLVAFRAYGLNARDDRATTAGLLPVPSRAYVISLPRRTDRYKAMEQLRAQLGVYWGYVSAEDSQSELVSRILSQVRSLREVEIKRSGQPSNTTIKIPFEWPPSLDSYSDTASSLQSEFLDLPHLPSAPQILNAAEPLTCAAENFTLLPYSPTLPEYKILTPSRVACWHSHVSVIRRVAALHHEEAALILEDDVDMELNIRERLRLVWSLLPPDWDIVFLGHCWSKESYYPALESLTTPSPSSREHNNSNATNSTEPTTRLHPSRGPLCTHAYAVSRQGARRIQRHLMHPPFAYSRAVDHALAWLVRSGRLQSFSLVPSVVVQRKVGSSDVMGGQGSKWRDGLIDGVLG